MKNQTGVQEDVENYSEDEEYNGHENFGEGNVEKSKLQRSWEDLERLKEQILKEAESLLSEALGEGKSENDASSVIREGEKFRARLRLKNISRKMKNLLQGGC